MFLARAAAPAEDRLEVDVDCSILPDEDDAKGEKSALAWMAPTGEMGGECESSSVPGLSISRLNWSLILIVSVGVDRCWRQSVCVLLSVADRHRARGVSYQRIHNTASP